MKNYFEQMTDEQIKKYLIRKVKKDQIVAIVCEEYDLYWFDEAFKNKKENIINMFFKPIKEHLITMGIETCEQMYKRILGDE